MGVLQDWLSTYDSDHVMLVTDACYEDRSSGQGRRDPAQSGDDDGELEEV